MGCSLIWMSSKRGSIELPNYRLPSLRNALLLMSDRAWEFVKTAGTTIMVISLVIWAAATYPKSGVSNFAPSVQSELAELTARGETDAAANLLDQQQLKYSLAGRLGHSLEPVFAPLGFDWKINVGVVSSFAAREVVVSTLAVLYGIGADGDTSESLLIDRLRGSRHADGRPVYTTAACLTALSENFETRKTCRKQRLYFSSRAA